MGCGAASNFRFDHYDFRRVLARLRELTTLFLVEKNIVSGAEDGRYRAHGSRRNMRILIAAGCLLISAVVRP